MKYIVLILFSLTPILRGQTDIKDSEIPNKLMTTLYGNYNIDSMSSKYLISKKDYSLMFAPNEPYEDSVIIEPKIIGLTHSVNNGTAQEHLALIHIAGEWGSMATMYDLLIGIRFNLIDDKVQVTLTKDLTALGSKYSTIKINSIQFGRNNVGFKLEYRASKGKINTLLLGIIENEFKVVADLETSGNNHTDCWERLDNGKVYSRTINGKELLTSEDLDRYWSPDCWNFDSAISIVESDKPFNDLMLVKSGTDMKGKVDDSSIFSFSKDDNTYMISN